MRRLGEVMSDLPITYDLSKSGGPKAITVVELTELAVQAKTKVKASARGWSMLSHHEVLALAWFADLHLVDADEKPPAPATPEPQVISHT